MLTLMVPYADLANHAEDNNSTFCLNRQNMRCAGRLPTQTQVAGYASLLNMHTTYCTGCTVPHPDRLPAPHSCCCCRCCRFELRSLQPLAAGEEVTISYGECKPNCDLLRDYGFIMPGNVWDRVLPLAAADGGAAVSAAAAAAAAADAEPSPPAVTLNPVTLLEVRRAAVKGTLLDLLSTNCAAGC
jgi:hypothetical protein